MEIKKNAIFVMSMPRLNPSEKAVPVAEPKAIASFCMRFELDHKVRPLVPGAIQMLNPPLNSGNTPPA